MKIRLTFKTPDVLDDAIEDMSAADQAAARTAADKWVSDGEYLTVDIDIETGECLVVPA